MRVRTAAWVGYRPCNVQLETPVSSASSSAGAILLAQPTMPGADASTARQPLNRLERRTMQSNTDILRRAARSARALRVLLRDMAVHLRVSPPSARHPLARIADQARWLFRNGITAENYYNYGFFRSGMPDEEKRAYIGSFELYRFFDVINEPSFTALTEDKLLFSEYATSRGVRVPRVLAAVGPATAPRGVRLLASPDALETYLHETPIEDFVVKPIAGVQGHAILSLGQRLGTTAEWRSLPSGATLDARAIAEHCRRFPRHQFVVQERLAAHPTLAALSPGVLSTIRLVTIRDPETRIVAAVLRVGRGNSAADNLHQSGIAVTVDLETGQCLDATEVVDLVPRPIRTHPSSGRPLVGFRLPEWEAAKALVRSAAEEFWFCPTLGWDVAITDRGPVVVETNRLWGMDLIQLAWRTGLLNTPVHELARATGAIRQVGPLARIR